MDRSLATATCSSSPAALVHRRHLRHAVPCGQTARPSACTAPPAVSRLASRPASLAPSPAPTTRRSIHPLVCSAAKGGSEAKGKGGKGKPQAPAPPAKTKGAAAKAAAEEEDEDEGEDGFLLDEDLEEMEEGEYEDEDEFGEDEDEGSEGDYASLLEPDDAPREVATGGTAWGEAVLRAAQEVLAQPALKGLELYLFRALPGQRKVDIRLDKLDDVYGSPSIDDIERFQRGMFAVLERELGAEEAGDISFEVSSPGAERIVRVPDELERFGGLPLRVEYRQPDGQPGSSVLVLEALDAAAASTAWRLANVRANATVKGRALTKKQLAQKVALPLADIVRVRIHVDF
ncbi:hypothetical protein HYH03_004069 [Edaphochlamys debaryana]|uniref:DUF7912 domain-containing protein n=1 Tax=Edaphochlamys debaryana TaxID=47281 RepID=A0A835YAM6_9CHLO|nr:hypothetical protein HYH03_004069 [Edaphochlamys debaryana]|eukprot:KAG2497798.1 hypothetical protein HYH03_004069 [Edaphochlamys debaryana]